MCVNPPGPTRRGSRWCWCPGRGCAAAPSTQRSSRRRAEAVAPPQLARPPGLHRSPRHPPSKTHNEARVSSNILLGVTCGLRCRKLASILGVGALFVSRSQVMKGPITSRAFSSGDLSVTPNVEEFAYRQIERTECSCPSARLTSPTDANDPNRRATGTPPAASPWKHTTRESTQKTYNTFKGRGRLQSFDRIVAFPRQPFFEINESSKNRSSLCLLQPFSVTAVRSAHQQLDVVAWVAPKLKTSPESKIFVKQTWISTKAERSATMAVGRTMKAVTHSAILNALRLWILQKMRNN